jgi:hypothetical protein
MNENIDETKIPVIRGDAITKERWLRRDIKVRGDERGGFKHYYATSILDVLLENDVITDSQHDSGMAYWRIKECAFPELGIADNPLYESATGEDEYNHEVGMTNGEASTLFTLITRMLHKRHRDAINASCAPACENAPLAIIWGFGVWGLTHAFEELETAMPQARRALGIRLDAQKKELEPA